MATIAQTPTTRSGTAAQPRSWFRCFAGRRYLRQIGTILILKLVLLTAIYYVFLKPPARPDASPAAIRQWLLDGPLPAPAPATPQS